MELLLLPFCFLLLWAMFGPKSSSAKDNRERLILGPNGRPLAFKRTSNDPPHEQFLHDGTPHRNPSVQTKTVTRWAFGLIPYRDEIEVSYYPLTEGTAGNVDLTALQERVRRAKARGYDVDLVEMDERTDRDQEMRENGEQLQRGVDGSRLTHRWNGKPKRRLI
jgi:hypothetical protein